MKQDNKKCSPLRFGVGDNNYIFTYEHSIHHHHYQHRHRYYRCWYHDHVLKCYMVKTTKYILSLIKCGKSYTDSMVTIITMINKDKTIRKNVTIINITNKSVTIMIAIVTLTKFKGRILLTPILMEDRTKKWIGPMTTLIIIIKHMMIRRTCNYLFSKS